MISSSPLQIRANQIAFERNGIPILHHLSLDIHAGDYLTVLGLNGSGKSTLLKLLLGLLTVNRGELWRDQQLRIGYVPQRWHPDPALPIHAQHFLSLSLGAQQSANAKSAKTLVMTSLEEWGLLAQAYQPIHTLSGGQWQRLLMARALIRQPTLLALDEPTQGVDLHGQHQLYHRLTELNQTGMTILLISHDIAHAMSYSQRVIALSEGSICCQGSPQTLLNDPAYQHRFICAHQHLAWEDEAANA
jgi:zinc transport system ATP-binding protein